MKWEDLRDLLKDKLILQIIISFDTLRLLLSIKLNKNTNSQIKSSPRSRS